MWRFLYSDSANFPNFGKDVNIKAAEVLRALRFRVLLVRGLIRGAEEELAGVDI